MTSNRFGIYSAVTVAGLSISLILSACGSQPAENATAQSPAPSLSASATSTPTALATPPLTATPSADAPAPAVPVAPAVPAAPVAPAVPAVPAAPVQPALKTFTFPDGHISFSYPASWSVRTQPGPGVEAIVSDRTGNDLFSISSGADGIGCAAGPVNRTVFDKAAVPGMREVDGTTPMLGFIVEKTGVDDWYFMAVMNPRNLEEGNVSSQCTLLKMGNGAAQNRVIFDQSVYPSPVPGFPSRQAARAWMATEQYAQLKALMMSLKYS